MSIEAEPTDLPPLGVVLAGGRSRRFGSDKALALYRGQAMIERVLERLGEHDSLAGLAIVANEVERYRALAAHHGALLLRDRVADRGPLGGLVSALLHAEREGHGGILAVACDMPLIEGEALAALLNAGLEEVSGDPGRLPDLSSDAVVGLFEGRRQPLFALYRRSALPILAARLERGQLSLRGALEALPRVRELPLRGRSAYNVNRPEHLDAIE